MWGWKELETGLYPTVAHLPPAPDDLVKIIRYKSTRCNYQKHGMKCTLYSGMWTLSWISLCNCRLLWCSQCCNDWWRSNNSMLIHIVSFMMIYIIWKLAINKKLLLSTHWNISMWVQIISFTIRSTDVNHWEKNRNWFDFLIHGEEIQFSNFRLRHLGKFEEFLARLGPRMKLIG